MEATLMTLLFLAGYTLIAMEYKIQINKSAISLLLGVLMWVIYLMGVDPSSQTTIVNTVLVNHVGDIAEIIFFLMGAMTIVEIIDTHGGFDFVNHRITTRKSKKLAWVIMLMTFFLSSVLDNLTTAIVMIMVIRKLIASQQDRWLYAGIVIVAANSGGAFSPIGDVTTILLWIHGNVSPLGIIKASFIPSFVSAVIPTYLATFFLDKHIEAPPASDDRKRDFKQYISRIERLAIFAIGLIGLILVPVFKSLTGLPPFMGAFSVLGILWCYTEILYREKQGVEESIKQRVSKVIKHIDIATVLFLFGILLSVAALQEAGILNSAARFLDTYVHNTYGVSSLIGLLSSVVDNGSLVAGVIGMYPIMSEATALASPDPAYLMNFVVDGEFWNLLAYCAGVGGSLLIIGSAAGVMVMGLEKMTFGWYMKNFSWMVLIGYLAGIGVYALQSVLFGLV